MSDCQHTRVRSWFFDDTRDPAGFWSCAGCGRKFEPVNFERDADAERYRWLRDNNYDRTVCQIHTIKHWYEPHSKTGEPTEWRVRLRGPRNLDAAIDAARAKP
mgnify:CR=1 FL=1